MQPIGIAGCTGTTSTPAQPAATAGAPAATQAAAAAPQNNLVPSPTDVVPDNNAVSVIVQEKVYDATIPVVFDGGKGQYLVKSAKVTVYRSDGQVITEVLGIKKGDEVRIQGTKQTDRVVGMGLRVERPDLQGCGRPERVPHPVTPHFFPVHKRIVPAMQVNWRWIHAARNTYAVLSAACRQDGILLQTVDHPADEVTCYSLNSINAAVYRDEIASADCLTVVGGPHATASPREVAGYADYVVVGEGEYTMPRLLQNLRNGGEGHIPGVMTSDSFEPARSSVRLDGYPAFAELKGYVEITRGCPHACGYCQTPQIFGHCMRHRSIDTVARFANRHEQARFVSPNALAYGSDGTHPRWDKVEHLLRACRNQIFFGTFPSEVRPEFVCDESLALITQYCANTKLHFGAQSGSDAVLRKLCRGHTVADVLRAADLCRDHGLDPVVDFIVGLPFEFDDDQRATLDLIEEIARRGIIHVHRFIPLPGTPLAGSVARELLPETENVLGKLALRGRLTGSWNDPAVRFFRHPSNDIP